MTAAKSDGLRPVILPFTQFGGRPDTGEDAVPAMRRALEAAAQTDGPVTLAVEPGRYDFYPAAAARQLYYVTNTASETENPDPTKTIGIHLQGIRDFTLDGGGALFVFHGKMTMLAIDGCERIAIRHVHLDYEWPTVTEMTVEAVTDTDMDIRVHPHSRYEIRDGELSWIGEGWRFRDGPLQACDLSRNITWRIDNLVAQASRAEELEPGVVRLHYDDGPYGRRPNVSAGWILQARDGIRDQVGVFIHRSRDVRLENAGIHFMHGLGIVGQFSEQLSLRRLDLSPRPETGRTVAAFADFVHLSGCRGGIEITDSRFAGAHDDAINVHGTHLRIVGLPAANEALVRFMHPQTYGFAAFHAGDEVEWIKPRTLLAAGRSRVAEARLLEPRTMLLMLSEPWPPGIAEGDVAENVTWTPEVEIAGNHFARIPTRGVLATTRRRTVIRDNVFERMGMSAVLVADDAASWYESGRVEDMRIAGNRFIECGSAEQAVIAIVPENEEASAEAPVHRNIRIERNTIVASEALVLEAKSVAGLIFRHNSVSVPPAGDADVERSDLREDGPDRGPASLTDVREAMRLTACDNVRIVDNSLASIE